MTKGPFCERRRLDGKSGDGSGSLKKRKYRRNECEAGVNYSDHGGACILPHVFCLGRW